MPQSVLRIARFMRLGGDVPALLVHPHWNAELGRTTAPAPVLVWMHGRTVNKELDPGRYLRLARAGVATCALDLPGHGERLDPTRQGPEATLGVVEQMVSELDGVVADLRSMPDFEGEPMAIGGMSAGGMATLVRLTSPHEFAAALVESTTGDLRAQATRSPFDAAHAARLDPATHLHEWKDVPLLGLHSQLDEWVPIGPQRAFFQALAARSAHPDRIRLHEFDQTGAPFEHSGFGRRANEAKDLGTRFLAEHLRPSAPIES